MEANKILIVGGSGYVGSNLTSFLIESGCEVSWLTRKINPNKKIKQYFWNYKEKTIDTDCFKNVETVINLSGSSINKRWTKINLQEIVESRIGTTKFLYESISKNKHSIKTFIQSSAIGYYGLEDNEHIFSEEDKVGNDLLAKLCKDWEHEAKQFSNLQIRTVILRLGVVFNPGSLAYEKFFSPFKFRLGLVLGNGNQNLNWIDIKDLSNLFLFAIQNKNVSGTYNACASAHYSYNYLITLYSQIKSKTLIKLKLPSFLAHLILGKVAQVYLSSIKVSNKKILEAGFIFENNQIQIA